MISVPLHNAMDAKVKEMMDEAFNQPYLIDEYHEQPEDKIVKAQSYKRKNQKHPAFKK